MHVRDCGSNIVFRAEDQHNNNKTKNYQCYWDSNTSLKTENIYCVLVELAHRNQYEHEQFGCCVFLKQRITKCCMVVYLEYILIRIFVLVHEFASTIFPILVTEIDWLIVDCVCFSYAWRCFVVVAYICGGVPGSVSPGTQLRATTTYVPYSRLQDGHAIYVVI